MTAAAYAPWLPIWLQTYISRFAMSCKDFCCDSILLSPKCELQKQPILAASPPILKASYIKLNWYELFATLLPGLSGSTRYMICGSGV